MSTHPAEAPGRSAGGPRRWAGRLGVAAFLFFLIKGLLWLAVPGVLAVVAWHNAGDGQTAANPEVSP